MSYYIQIARYVLRLKPRQLPDSDPLDYRPLIIPIELGGDNNVINDYTGRSSRRWTVGSIHSSETEFMQSIVRESALCEGGSLTLDGRRITPEDYIKRWRKALENPLAIEIIRGLCPELLQFEYNAHNVPLAKARKLTADYPDIPLAITQTSARSEGVLNARLNLSRDPELNLFNFLRITYPIQLVNTVAIPDQDMHLLSQIKFEEHQNALW